MTRPPIRWGSFVSHRWEAVGVLGRAASSVQRVGQSAAALLCGCLPSTANTRWYARPVGTGTEPWQTRTFDSLAIVSYNM